MPKHFVFSAATKLKSWRNKREIPQQLESGYFTTVEPGDVIWVVQCITQPDADILSRFAVSSVERVGRKIHVSSLTQPGFHALSMRKHRLRAEFVETPGTPGGIVTCDLGGATNFKRPYHRGFRTGWQLTPEVAEQFEAAWRTAETEGADNSVTDSPPSRMEAVPEFDPDQVTDDAERVRQEIKARSGQDKFRESLLRAYDGRCAVTGCKATAALEAAHITPFSGPSTHHVANGLLMRSDIHTLFDLDLIRVHPVKRIIVVDESLRGTEYARLAGKKLREPRHPQERPHKDALRQRWGRTPAAAR